jgi:RHS repeat-associated protein/uncharacterized repeat protein (TIGR01451 family)
MNEYTQVGDVTYQYDADGNLVAQTQGGVTSTYAYNSLDQLLALSSPTGNASFEYDPFGMQYSATHGGQTTVNQRDYSNLGIITAQVDGSGALLADYTAASGLVSEVTAHEAAYYFDADNIGNIVGVTDQNGAYVNHYQYLPFGETETLKRSIANPFTFGGMNFVMMQGTGLATMGYRPYDPFQGRFLSGDPLGLGGGDANTRRYVLNDPINLNDALGLCATLRVTTASAPHAQFFFDKRLVTSGGALPPNAGFFGKVDPVPGIAGWAGPAFGGSVSNDEGYRTIAWYDDDYALWQAMQQVAAIYNGQNVQFQLYDGHSLADALFNHLLDAPYFHPQSPWGLTHHPSIDQVRQSNCQEYAYWVNVKYFEITTSPSYTASKDIQPCDPNDLSGPAGVGPNQSILPGETLPYRVEFENEPDASAPAQNVVVTEQLDANLDWSTFQLSSIGFGAYLGVGPK